MNITNQSIQNQSALFHNSESPESNYRLGVRYHNSGQFLEAKQFYYKAIALKPDYTEVYVNLAKIYQQEQDFTKAIDYYKRAIKCDPNYLNAYNNLADLFLQQKEYEQALYYYHQALELDPLWEGIYNNLGYLYLLQDQLDQAFFYLQRAIKINPNLAMAHYNMGVLWMKNFDLVASVGCFDKVLTLEPENIAAYNNCAYSLIILGKMPQAWEYLVKAIALQPHFINSWIQRVKQLSGEDILERAKLNLAAFLEGLLNKQPWSEISNYLFYTYTYKGDVWFEYGSYKLAEGAYQLALQFEHKNIEIYLRLGKALAKQGRFQSAILIYHFALQIQPDHPKILFQLAQTLTQHKQFDQAIKYYEKLLQLPDTARLSISPSLNPQKPPTPPQGIYSRTENWLKKVRLNSYLKVNWGPELEANQDFNCDPILSPLEPILHQCMGVNCVSCMKDLCNLFQPQQIQQGIYFCQQNEPLKQKKPETFIAMIPQGRAWLVPQKNSWLITNAIAIITPDNYLLGDLSRFYPWKLPNCDKHDPKSHPIFHLETIPPVKKIEGNVVFLSTLAAHVYYHWLIDLIPRLGMMIKSGLNLDKVDFFVVNNLNKPYQKETLEKLGIPLTKIIESDRHPHIQAQRLIVPSWPGDLDWPLSGTINFLRKTYLKNPVSQGKKYPERIYISRAKSNHRHVINEPKVLELIAKNGFIPIFLETLSFSEQVQLFNHAKYIIAPHGSGLTNILFCNPNTTVIEFFAPRYVRSDYLIISQQLRLKHFYLLGESFNCAPLRELMYESPITDDILVNLSQLETLLNLLFPPI